jgi:O-antigen/teichoic acid export membrane protein
MENGSSKTLSLQVLNRVWKSATFTSWGSFIARSLSIALVLPLVVTRFSTEEISLWYLFAIIMNLRVIADMGFSATFARVFAYAMGGAEDIEGYLDIQRKPDSGKPNWETTSKLCSTMDRVYSRIALGWFTLLASLGTLAVIKPIAMNQRHLMAGWLAWGIIVATSSLRMYGNKYISYLIGINEISLYRRWETLNWILTTIVSLLVLMLGSGLLGLVIATQSLMVLGVGVNRWLFRALSAKHIDHLRRSKPDRKVFLAIWPNAWRSGVGGTVGIGLIQATGIFYAQIGSAGNVAAYLLALNLIRALSQFSGVPFYSKIPALSRLRAEGKLTQQQKLAEKGMRWCFCILTAGIVILGVFGPLLLEHIKGNTSFVAYDLWALMGLAAFLERYGAMHIQLYSTSNHIITHIANAVTGLIFVMAVALGYKFWGIYTFPIAQIASNLSFYNWYAARHSYGAFRLRFWYFERRTVFVPFIMLLVYCIIMTLCV